MDRFPEQILLDKSDVLLIIESLPWEVLLRRHDGRGFTTHETAPMHMHDVRKEVAKHVDLLGYQRRGQ